MALKEFGFRPGEVACVLAPTSPAWVTTDLGILSAGGISAGLYTTDAPEQVQATLDACGCRIVFVGNEEQLDTVLRVRAGCPALEKIVIYDVQGSARLQRPDVRQLPGVPRARRGLRRIATGRLDGDARSAGWRGRAPP